MAKFARPPSVNQPVLSAASKSTIVFSFLSLVCFLIFAAHQQRGADVFSYAAWTTTTTANGKQTSEKGVTFDGSKDNNNCVTSVNGENRTLELPGSALDQPIKGDADALPNASKSLVLSSIGDCYQSSGYWAFNPWPRRIAWNRYGSRLLSRCDTFYANESGVAFVGETGVLAAQGHWFVRDALKYDWVSKEGSQCPMVLFNRTHACSILGANQQVLLIGDSFNEHFAMTLRNHFAAPSPGDDSTVNRFREEDPEHSGPGHDLCADVVSPSSAPNFETIRMIRSDHLSTSKEMDWNEADNVLHAPWGEALTSQVKIVVINMGLHYQPDEDFSRNLEAAVKLIRQSLPNVMLIYRSSPTGHPDCLASLGPIDTFDPEGELPYHWGSMQRQNNIARPIIESWGGVFMDIYRMTSLRPDGHLVRANFGDCLHYCMPGPMDAWAKVFYNLIAKADAGGAFEENHSNLGEER